MTHAAEGYPEPGEDRYQILLNKFATVLRQEKSGELSSEAADIALNGLIEISASYGVDPRERMRTIAEDILEGRGWN